MEEITENSRLFYKIISFDKVPGRFVIADIHGNILNDANGYGYKTEYSAMGAREFLFYGGAELKATKKQCHFYKKDKQRCKMFAYLGENYCDRHKRK